MTNASLILVLVSAVPRFGSAWSEPARVEPDRAVVLSAAWCGPCQKLKAELVELESRGWSSGTSSRNHFQIVDVDAEPALWERLRKPGSSSIPQIVFLKDGKPARWLVGPASAAACTWFYLGRESSGNSSRVVEVRRRVPDFLGVFE